MRGAVDGAEIAIVHIPEVRTESGPAPYKSLSVRRSHNQLVMRSGVLEVHRGASSGSDNWSYRTGDRAICRL